jgi:CBS-domain-containing membrane protein
MRNVNLPLSVLTAEDLMGDTVLLIPQDMSLRTAAHLLCAAHITGAPIVNASGACVGVLSATDFLRHADAEVENSVGDYEQPCASRETVGDCMSTDPVLAEPTTPVMTLARRMFDVHKHRAIVVDEHCHPIGVVSATDVLAAVACTVEPAEEFQLELCCRI